MSWSSLSSWLMEPKRSEGSYREHNLNWRSQRKMSQMPTDLSIAKARRRTSNTRASLWTTRTRWPLSVVSHYWATVTTIAHQLSSSEARKCSLQQLLMHHRTRRSTTHWTIAKRATNNCTNETNKRRMRMRLTVLESNQVQGMYLTCEDTV